MLKTKLASMKEPDADAYLARLWTDFSRTEFFEALTIGLESLNTEAEQILLKPSASDRERAHAAGQVTILRRIFVTISAAISFNPATAVYTEEAATGAVDEDLPEDDTQLY